MVIIEYTITARAQKTVTRDGVISIIVIGNGGKAKFYAVI